MLPRCTLSICTIRRMLNAINPIEIQHYHGSKASNHQFTQLSNRPIMKSSRHHFTCPEAQSSDAWSHLCFSSRNQPICQDSGQQTRLEVGSWKADSDHPRHPTNGKKEKRTHTDSLTHRTIIYIRILHISFSPPRIHIHILASADPVSNASPPSNRPCSPLHWPQQLETSVQLTTPFVSRKAHSTRPERGQLTSPIPSGALTANAHSAVSNG